MKVLWVDVESTGLDPVKNDIVSIALMAEIDGEIKGKLYLEIQPHSYDNIEDQALEVNGFTREQLKTFLPPLEAHKKIVNFLSKYINKFNKKDKFQPSGYNVVFDVDMLGEFFKKCNDRYYGSFIDYHKFDVATLVQFLHLKGAIKLDSYRLENVCNYFGITLKAHNAKEDIQATRELCYKILNTVEVKNVNT